MKIKEIRNHDYVASVKDYFSGHPGRKTLFIVLGSFFILIALFVSIVTVTVIGISKYPQALKAKNEMLATARNIVSLRQCIIPWYTIKGLLSNPKRIAIDIKYKDLQKLAYARAIMLKAGRKGVKAPLEYVPATIRYNNTIVPVKIRLKGTRRVNFEDENRWSLRVKTVGDTSLFGMKRFSLHHASMRNYIYEWLFHELLRREDLLSLRYLFFSLSLNGKNLGTYAMEEHFGKELIENNQEREGPILRFGRREGVATDIFTCPIEVYGEDRLSRTGNIDMMNMGISLLDSFRQKRKKVSDVFNVKRLGSFFAVTDLLGMHHGAVWPQMRFYYNPVSSRLEPIGYDGHFGVERTPLIAAELGLNPQGRWLHDTFGDWFRLLFNDPDSFDEDFFSEYVSTLERISQPSYLEGFFADINNALERNLALIYRDFLPLADHIFYFGPDIFAFSKQDFLERQAYIRQVLNPPQALEAHYKESDEDTVVIEMGNIQKLPLEILHVIYRDTVVLEPERRVILLPVAVSCAPRYVDARFKIPKGMEWSDSSPAFLEVSYRILGASRIRIEEVHPYSRYADDLMEDDLIRQPPNADDFVFLSIDTQQKNIHIKAGRWDVSRNLIIPPGYTLTCGEGVHLNITGSAKVLSYSPIRILGSEQEPVVISSDDKTGQGIVVLNTERESVLRNVIIRGVSSPAQGAWKLTGAVTFYRAPVKIYACQFLDIDAEDALNLIRSDFILEQSKFDNVSSDAVDVDFSNGKIAGTYFSDCKNDAIDISGSNVTLSDVSIKKAGDKGISVGENSAMTVKTILISEAPIAFASKDMSRLGIADATVSTCAVGIAVYQKKPEFGPASVSAVRLNMDGVTTPYAVERNSRLQVDGKTIKASGTDVKKLVGSHTAP